MALQAKLGNTHDLNDEPMAGSDYAYFDSDSSA
jgi:hypothetical protein